MQPSTSLDATWLPYVNWAHAQKYMPGLFSRDPSQTTAEDPSLEDRLLENEHLDLPLEKQDDPFLKELLNNLYAGQKPHKAGHYHLTDHPSRYGLETPTETTLLSPGNWVISRVPRDVLGPNVLGRCWPNTGIIEILNTLTGADYDEVQQHEFNHLLHPEESESQVRYRTRCMGHDKYN